MSAAKKREAAASASKETVVYVGPSLRGIAERNTTFNNGLTKELIQAIEKQPVIRNLIVPLPQLSEAIKQINNQQGAYYAFYKQALEKGE